MLATNIAALVVVRKGGLDAQSLQQIYNSWIFLKVIAINGFLPITFTLANLYIVGMLSWYLILMSTLSVALSIATFAVVGRFDPSESEMGRLATIATVGGPVECDYRQPGVYCYKPIGDNTSSAYYYYSAPDQRSSSVDSHAYSILGFCLVVMVLLLGHMSKSRYLALTGFVRRGASSRSHAFVHGLSEFLQNFGHHHLITLLTSRTKQAARTCWKHIQRFPALYRKISSLRRLEYWITAQGTKFRNSKAWQTYAYRSARIWHDVQERARTIRWKHSVQVAFKSGVFILFSSLYLRFFTMFLRDLAWFAKNNVYSDTWNFGQIVAITVWAPPIVEFIHLEIRGVQRGFDHRLLPPFGVSRMRPGVEHATAEATTASGNARPTKQYNGDDIGTSYEAPLHGTNAMQLDLSVPVGNGEEDNNVLMNVLLGPDDNDDGNDINNTKEALQDDPNGGPAAIMPLREEVETEGDQEWLLPVIEMPSRAMRFSRFNQ